MSIAQLAAIADELESDAGASITTNSSQAGLWLRIATALESLAGESTTTSATLHGYMLRAVNAAETIGATTGEDENANRQGYLERIVEALENANSTTYTGSYLNRFYLASVDFTGDPPTEVPVNLTLPEFDAAAYAIGASPTWTNGTWSNGPVVSRAHNLYSDGVLIAGGPYTSGSYVLTSEEGAKDLTVREIATNVVGPSLAAESDEAIVTVVLAALSLNDPSIPQDVAAEILIFGATDGSTLSVSDGALPTGLTLNSAARTITGTPTVGEATEFTLDEDFAYGSNSPRSTVLTINVEAHTIYNTTGDSTLDADQVVGFVDGATAIEVLINAISAQAPIDYDDTVNNILIQLDYSITLLEGGDPEWDPATLFTADARGAAWDLTDLDTLFQDIAGTTPVTTTGQYVGKMLDVSGKNNHWVAAADNTTRPTYEVDGDGKPYLSFTGNDVMYAATPFAGGTTKPEVQVNAIVGMLAATPGASMRPLMAGGTGTNPVFSMLHCATDGSVTMAVINDSGQSFSPMAALAGALDGATKRIVNSQFLGPNETQRIRDAVGRPSGGGTGNYTELAEGSLTIAYTPTRASLGASTLTTPSSFYTGRIYSGIVINRATTGMLTEAEITAAEDWVNARTRTSSLP